MTWFAQRLPPAADGTRGDGATAGAGLERKSPSQTFLSPLLNRDLPEEVRITHRNLWPLWILPIALLNQLITPHPVWIVLFISLLIMYGVALLWVRTQALAVGLKRRRVGALLLAGDTLREEFELHNESPLPLLWAEFVDYSTIPDYAAGRVVGCGAASTYRWHTNFECKQRGVFQLGPYDVQFADPLGFFQVTIRYDDVDAVLIYPRVAHLPIVALPHGDTSGAARRRRPISGPIPSATVRDYRPADSLRYIHWPLTAHRGALMVKELEIEPSGGVWIVLDLNGAVHRTVGEVSTLEFSVIVAASLAGELLGAGDRRAVGLLTVSDHKPLPMLIDPDGSPFAPLPAPPGANGVMAAQERAVLTPPQTGQAQLWRILAALAPVQETDLPLTELLRTNRRVIGRRGTVVVITPQLTTPPDEVPWTAELLSMESSGLASSVVLITAPDDPAESAAPLRTFLTGHDIPVQTLQAGTRLPPALTFRRTRKVVRSTPQGGAVSYEVEEEVG